MSTLHYEAPSSVEAAVKLLADAKGLAKILAGGTDLLVQMRSKVVKPGLVVDIKKIPDLGRVTVEADGSIRVGAAVPGAVLSEHAALIKAYPGFVEAVDLIGSTQIQGRASAGGNLCNASPAADSVPAMIAAGAICTVAGPSGTRKVPAEQIGIAPGRTSLQKGEFVVDFVFPARKPHSADAYLRMIPRTEMDIAIVGAGVNLTLDRAGTITEARVALGAVAPTVLLVSEAAKAIVGGKLDDAALQRLDAAARAACKPIDDKRGTIAYRTKVAGVLARRAAAIAYERARSN